MSVRICKLCGSHLVEADKPDLYYLCAHYRSINAILNQLINAGISEPEPKNER